MRTHKLLRDKAGYIHVCVAKSLRELISTVPYHCCPKTIQKTLMSHNLALGDTCSFFTMNMGTVDYFESMAQKILTSVSVY